jgi:HNH endonuclease
MSYGPKQTLKQGYEKFVIRNSEGCWDWKGCCPKNPGYGQFRSNGKIHKAHRSSWLIHKGEIPKGMFVCHTCDNKRCSNPDHLFLGTCKDNNLDAIKKNILPFGKIGKENHRCKLSDEDVIKVKEMIDQKISQCKISKIFGVSQTLISLINLGKLRGGLFLKQD